MSKYFGPGSTTHDAAAQLIQCENDANRKLNIARSSNYSKINYKCTNDVINLFLNNSTNDTTETNNQRIYHLTRIKGLGGRTQYGNSVNIQNIGQFPGTVQGQPGGMQLAPRNRF